MSTADSMSNDTPRGRSSSLLSPPPTSAVSPTWGRPKSPLPPHRLAKLANALGVSTPMPAVHNALPLLSSSYPSSSPSPSHLDHFRRSPTPSTASSFNLTSYAQSTSKFLLHIIPPLYLPHDSDASDYSELTPPPPTASGYHTQFRRGTLVPMHSTLSSQLGAIAKEYALPSTAGLILYLVLPIAKNAEPSMNTQGPLDQDMEEPGPRLSEDIWKHLWTRVARVEREEMTRAATPHMLGLGSANSEGPSSPYSAHDPAHPPLRPFISAGVVEAPHPQGPLRPFTPSSYTPSSAFELRSQTKSAPPSASSASQSDPDTPDTSLPPSADELASRANSLDLPGLHSPSFVPILAKVEFDIDKRRAGWFEPWLRSRRMNHAKRAESRLDRKGSAAEDGDAETEGADKKAPLDLRLVGRMQTSSPISFIQSAGDQTATKDSAVEQSVTNTPDEDEDVVENEGYEALSEPLEGSEYGDDSDDDEATEKIMSLGSKDPLGDVFGSDEDTWAELHSSQRDSKRTTNPAVVDLALTAADLAALPPQASSDEGEVAGTKEVDEVQALLDQMSGPIITKSPPSSPVSSPNRSSSPSTVTGRKNVPPPLVIQTGPSSNDLGPPADGSMPSSATSLPYLHSSPSDPPASQESDNNADEVDDDSDEYTRVRSPAESEKRIGGVFDDFDLGLEFDDGEFDENDPEDRRKSQYMMKAQLDEIERNLAQFSPRRLKTDLAEEQNMFMNSATLSPFPSPSHPTLSPNSTRNGDALSLSPSPNQSDLPVMGASWPAVPFSSIKEPSSPPSKRVGPPSPPRLAVNGVTTAAPKAYLQHHSISTSSDASESESRKRQLAEQQSIYPALGPSLGHSPIIPLSPDPFGRFSSTPVSGGDSQPTSFYWGEPTLVDQVSPPPSYASRQSSTSEATISGQSRNSTAPSSRFSADSATGEELVTKVATNNRSTLMTVKSIKKLWRKSNNKSISGPVPPTPGRVSPTAPLNPVQEQSSSHRPSIDSRASHDGRPSQEKMPRPEQLGVPQQARQMPPPPVQQHARGGSNLDVLHFDQESPYPVRRSPSTRPTPSPVLTSTPEESSSGKEKEKTGVRKSILKSWKSVGGSLAQAANGNANSSAEPRSSTEQGRPRRPSVLSFTSGRASTVSSPTPEIPPSPAIPEHFVGTRQRNGSGDQGRRQSVRQSKASSASSDWARGAAPGSPQRSLMSSGGSEDGRPSFDASQFEIVSPKVGSTLSYPYHGMDHD